VLRGRFALIWDARSVSTLPQKANDRRQIGKGGERRAIDPRYAPLPVNRGSRVMVARVADRVLLPALVCRSVAGAIDKYRTGGSPW
jgi:hypothetical protein